MIWCVILKTQNGSILGVDITYIRTFGECKDILGQCVSAHLRADMHGPKHVNRGTLDPDLNVFLIE